MKCRICYKYINCFDYDCFEGLCIDYYSEIVENFKNGLLYDDK